MGRINEWVSNKTEGKISRLLDSAPSPPMFLSGAVYFHASWAHSKNKPIVNSRFTLPMVQLRKSK